MKRNSQGLVTVRPKGDTDPANYQQISPGLLEMFGDDVEEVDEDADRKAKKASRPAAKTSQEG